jgi:hypothetical protein
MLLEYIENLRNKPSEVKKTYTLVFTISITFFIVLIWFMSYFLGLLGTRAPDDFFGSVKENTQPQDESNPNSISNLFNESNQFLKDDNSASEGTNEGWVKDLQKIDTASTSQNALQPEGTSTARSIFEISN